MLTVEKAVRRENKVFFAYFLVHKKVSGGLERTRTSDLTLIRRAL